MYPHIIRLRGPWDAVTTSKSIRVTLPGTWSQITESANVTLTRKFGRPRILDSDERVWLVWSNVAAPADLTLNDQAIATLQKSHGSHEITGALEARNTIAVRHNAAPPPTASLGEYALEIRGPVFLDQLRIESHSGQRFINGKMIGEVKGQLDLYVLIYGRTVSHELIRTEPGGVAFQMPCPTQESGPASAGFPALRIELVEGATCWWRADFSLESEVPLWPASASMPE